MSTTVAIFVAVAPNSNVEMGTPEAISAASIRQVSDHPTYVEVSELNANGFIPKELQPRYRARMMAICHKVGIR